MKNIQAVILAAGKSSRFYPFSNGVHKTMISLLGKPILAHTVDGIKKIGINKIVMIVKDDGAIKKYFGNGKRFGVSITYVIQKEALGMGDALLKASKNIKGDFIFLGGNHVNSHLLIADLMNKNKKGIDGIVVTKRRDDTWDYGVVKLKGDRVSSVVEKPKRGSEPSKDCLVSIYYLPADFIMVLKKIKNHHYSFEEALNNFAKKKNIVACQTGHEITTLKYPWHLLNIKNYLLKTIKSSLGKATIAKSAEIIGNVIISDGAKIMEGVHIKGPCYIGENVYIGNNALLRNGVDIEKGSVVGAYMEIKNSLVMEDAKTHSGFIGDSIIGQNCRIGGSFSTANVRIDRGFVKAKILDQKIETSFKYLGAILGHNVRVGVRASTMPGVIIGSSAVVGPSTVVVSNIPQNTRYYTKFQEIIEEKVK